MSKVLVTGASGQLGTCIKKIAKSYPSLEMIFMDSQELDITDLEKVFQVFKSDQLDFCINCAAFTNVEQAEKTPERAFKINAEGVKNISLACKQHKVVLVHISTDYVFDGEKDSPYTTNDLPYPINEYGKSKLRGEKYVQELLDNYFIIRTSWLYSKFGKNFYKTILKKAKTEKVLYITDEQKGCPTNANSLSKYILDHIASSNDNYGLHHFTDGEAMTWFDFARRIIENSQLSTTTKIVRCNNYSSFAKRPKYSVLNNEKQ
jgi:dTDP-4-dehydrorhamnose reductase